MSAHTKLATVVLDCGDPAKLAEFYREATGWDLVHSDDDGAALTDGGPIQLGFQRIDGYQAPGWPDARKHAHLDLKVTDLTVATRELLALGAVKPDLQPGGDEWVVLLDPEGHPFCLVP